MKSFRQFIYTEDMANPRDVSRQATKDIAPLYKWLTQQSGKNLVKKDKHWAKTRDAVAAEIAKRAQKGEKDAKAVFRNLELDKIWKRGQPQFASEEALEEWDSKYIVEKNPHDKKWYVIGHVGRNKWMPVSNGFKSKPEAQKWAKIQSKVVNPAAAKELEGI